MPVKPTLPVTVRASALNYVGGPVALQGTPTKIARPGADMAEGHWVDSPLGTYPVTAQSRNYEENITDVYTEWVSLGSNQNDPDAHIVETDGSGDINVVGVNCSNIQVVTSGLTDGIAMTVFSSAYGIDILRDASHTDDAVRIISTDGASGHSLNIQSANCDAILVDNTGSGISFEAIHQTSPAILIRPTPAGGIVGPGIKLLTSTSPSNDLSVGTIWGQEENGVDALKAGNGVGAGYLSRTISSPCYGRGTDVSVSFVGAGGFSATIDTFSFLTGFEPTTTSNVRVTISGQVTLPAAALATGNTVTIELQDDTLASVVCTTTVSVAQANVAMSLPVTISKIYPVLAGARSFTLKWSGSIDDTEQVQFVGFAEVGTAF
jgi:hypothetical protein